MNNEIEFYIPNTLNIREILIKENKRERYIDSQIDKYHWFLDYIYKQSILNKKFVMGDFIPMNNAVMDKLLGSRYIYDIKHILPKHGIIECDGEYEEGVKSLGFRLTPEYQVMHYRRLKDSNSEFIKKLQSMNLITISKMDTITRYTYHQLNDLGIHVEEALKHVEEWYANNMLVENPVLVNKLKKQNKKRKKAEHKARKKGHDVQYLAFTYEQMLELMKDSYLYQIRCIDEKLWLPKRDDKGRRMHTYISNAWSELRQFIYIKSSPNIQLISLDCSNSQPYTFVKILLEYFKGVDLYTSPFTDIIDYIELVTAGKLYTFMCQKLGISDPKEIAEFKVDMFANVFYSKNEEGYHTKEAKAFRKYFPTVYQIVMQEKKTWYKSLSIKMQRVETSAVIDIALATLMDKYGKSVWFGSIHDSIICPSGYETEVRQLMLDAYTNVVGVSPHIKPAEKFNDVKVTPQITEEFDKIDSAALEEAERLYKVLLRSKLHDDCTAVESPKTSHKPNRNLKVINQGIPL
ncbi:hypothetical protein [Rufibacter immobilis]|uniref:hypothetical protein n=1 Tax=Rufibacter immobilis TaxID=1348778 RepID=UPI0035E5DEA9